MGWAQIKHCKILILFTLLFNCWLLIGCSTLLYYPEKNMIMNPQRWGLEPEDVFFANSDGQRLHGWWFAAKGPYQGKSLGTFIFFHGNAENVSSHFAMLSWLPSLGYNYFIFDYPGYGLSAGSPSPEMNVHAGEEAIKWVAANKDQRPLIIYAHSIGGITALRSVEEVLSAEKPVSLAGVVVDGTFLSYQAIAKEKLSEHWVTWLFQPLAYLFLSDRWAPKDIQKISPHPLLVLHGTDDPVVPFFFGQELYQKAAEPKKFVQVDGGQHGDAFLVDQQKYRQVMLDEVSRWLKK